MCYLTLVAHTGYDYNYDKYPENHIGIELAAALLAAVMRLFLAAAALLLHFFTAFIHCRCPPFLMIYYIL